jgi:5-formyltetrahydrofolate cyclo-ligase
MTKAQLRSELKSRLGKMSVDERKNAEVLLVQKLLKLVLSLSNKNQVNIWGIYQAHQFEPNLLSLCKKTESEGLQIRWAFPVVDGSLNGLRWLIPGAKGFEKAAFGILEPQKEGATEVAITEFTGLFIPGIGFDQTGARLGRGQGYYDRALAQHETKGIVFRKLVKVGVAFHCQLMNELPLEIHDIKMDQVITDQVELVF